MKTFITSLSLTMLLFFSNLLNAQNWKTIGNAGTTPGVNFIGTTDAQSLIFKINNQQAGLLDSATGTTSFGYKALLKNTGRYNSAFGYQALTANTTGLYNTALGYKSLTANTVGSSNTAIGIQALYSNVQGTANTAIGSSAMIANNSGSYNTANGNGALQYNTSGGYNTAAGNNAMNQNTTGKYNTASGASAFYNNKTGNYNSAFGSYALSFNSTGNSNTAIGEHALYSNTTGYGNVGIGIRALYHGVDTYNMVAIGDSALFTQSIGSYLGGVDDFVHVVNTAVGSKALLSNTTGSQNTANGFQSLYSNQVGSGNTATGDEALYLNTNGDANTALGYGTLFNNKTGSDNTAVGSSAGPSATNLSNTTALGFNAVPTASNQVMLGNTSVTSVKAAGNITIVSDGRFKKNIKENVPGLAFINQLRPVTYHYDIHGMNNKMDVTSENKNTSDASGVGDNTDADKTIEDAINTKEQILYTGFVAQEVETAAKKINYDFSGLYKPQNDKDLYGLSYADFVVPLVKAVQELSKQNDSLKNNYDTKISELQNQINQLKSMIVSGNKSSAINQQSTVISSASLAQNIPNPFSNTTSINYSIPQKFSSAQIIVTDQNGKVLKQENVNSTGKGSLNVDASTLSSGAYSYSLIVDGRLIDTKKMVLAK